MIAIYTDAHLNEYRIFCFQLFIFSFTRGCEPVDDKKVIKVYGDTYIPMDLLETDHKVQ